VRPGAKIVGDPTKAAPGAEPALEGDPLATPLSLSVDEWGIEPELGAAGAPPKPMPPKPE
jgi:hypothetical protein